MPQSAAYGNYAKYLSAPLEEIENRYSSNANVQQQAEAVNSRDDRNYSNLLDEYLKNTTANKYKSQKLTVPSIKSFEAGGSAEKENAKKGGYQKESFEERYKAFELEQELRKKSSSSAGKTRTRSKSKTKYQSPREQQ